MAVSFSPGMLGLDRTDAGATNKPGGAAAKLACGHTDSFFTWARNTGACEIPKELPCEGQGLASVTYQTISKESCSRVLADQKVEVTASPGGNATTNFTVVKVDVTIDGVGEDKEETEGALIAVSNALVSVSIQCFPDDLTGNVSISGSSSFLYEVADGGEYKEAQQSYTVSELKTKQFCLRELTTVSSSFKDKAIVVTHDESNAKDKAVFTVFGLGDTGVFSEPTGKWLMVWIEAGGLSCNDINITPDPGDLRVEWELLGVPALNTEIRWSSSKAERPEIGTGASPKLTIKYVATTPYKDQWPLKNDLFGEKQISVCIGERLTFSRSVFHCYSLLFKREKNAAPPSTFASWYGYYIENNAVQKLLLFTYDDTLKHQGTYNPRTDVLKIGPNATFVEKPYIKDGKYEQENYDGRGGFGCHAIAKICEHEWWHQKLHAMCELWFPPGSPSPPMIFINDKDKDGLPDDLENEIGADPLRKDSFHFATQPEFSSYAKKADSEVFCRLKEVNAWGNAHCDWAFPGVQLYCSE